MKTTYSWKVTSKQIQSQKLRPTRKLKKFISRVAEICRLPVEKDWVFNVIFFDDKKMAQANELYVGHQGTTDVITFSYLEDEASMFPGDIGVELFICVDVAEREGFKRKKSNFYQELALYIIHGALHAANYDDLEVQARKLMRSAEHRVMKKVKQEFDFSELFQIVEN